MNVSDKMVCLAAHFAVGAKPASDFDAVISAARETGLQDTLKDCLFILDAPRLLRRLARYGPAAPLDWDTVTVQDDEVLWQGNAIGQLRTFYKIAFPQEAQARIAYEVFLDRFLDYIQRTYKVAVLHQGDADVVLFVPEGVDFDLMTAWDAFVDWAFSAEELRKSFILLVNSIRLSEGGFSTLGLPIVSEEQALVLAAFYRANLLMLERGDEQRRRDIAQLQGDLAVVKTRKEREKIKKKMAGLEDELKTRAKRYDKTYAAMGALRRRYPDWVGKAERVARREMGGQAGLQLSKRENIVAKYVSEMEKLAEMDKFFRLPPILAEAPPGWEVRGGGDAGGEFCYACGRRFGSKETKYKAGKFVFESPSQRLQSGGGQKEPKICATCMAISFVSPIKTGSNRLVIRLRRPGDDGRYLLEDHLRGFTMGKLDVAAGRYALIQVQEQVPRRGGRKPLPNVMGRRQYALYKVATLFPAEVFREYWVEALIGDAEVTLPSRHLNAVRGLIEVFGLDGRRWWENKGQLSAVAQAICYIEREEVILATYELLRGGLLRSNRFYITQSSRLEALYEDHWRWLMNEKPSEAQRFRDVAAMTGLLYAFCDFVRQSVKGDKQRIEVRKLIERATDPFDFNYTAAGNTKSERATLFHSADLYFCLEQAKALLEELGVDTAEREGVTEKGTATLTFYFDDVVKAYTHLFENRYPTPKAQRDFTYTLRLSLQSRFPELMKREERGG